MRDAPPDLAELAPDEIEEELSGLGAEACHGRQVNR